MLLKNDTQIIRVLQTKDDMSLVIDCMKRTMPIWFFDSELSGYVPCSERELSEMTDFPLDRELTEDEQRIAQEHYTMISGVLPFIGDEQKRSKMIDFLSDSQSKQTIRKYLCLYLTYQTIAALAPAQKKEKELTQDEKIMRWALNQFFYTKNKNSLQTAYTMMLKEKYCDNLGRLLPEYPSFNQFRYFYRKTKSLQKMYISRNGIKDYERNNRPLLGDGVQQFAPNVGVGMLDATICDIYLVDDAGKLVGRPVLTACVDAYSGLCNGYSLGWEGGVYSLRGLMLNVVADKVKWCKEHGVIIDRSQWDSSKIPGTLVTDMGSEYAGDTFSQITELGVKVVNLNPYRPELKGRVEKFFDLIQNSFKTQLKGKGVIEPDYQERGAHDYRKDACLTLAQFEKIILHCILFYNNRRIMDFPFSESMIAAGVKPYARSIFEWGRNQLGANLIDMNAQRLIQVLLPRATGTFTRKGLRVNGLRYQHEDYTEAFLKGGEATVAYNSEDVTEVWVIEKGKYVPFTLIESSLSGKSLGEVQTIQKARKKIVGAAAADSLQAKIDLAEHIRVIANQGKHSDVGLKNIRNTRKREQTRTHIDYVKEGQIYG